MKSTKDGDWWLTVLDDLSELQLELSLHEIKIMSKDALKNRVKKSTSAQAFKWLEEKKSELKKVKAIHHSDLEMSKYLSSPILSFPYEM